VGFLDALRWLLGAKWQDAGPETGYDIRVSTVGRTLDARGGG
jgi:hypothetical protein